MIETAYINANSSSDMTQDGPTVNFPWRFEDPETNWFFSADKPMARDETKSRKSFEHQSWGYRSPLGSYDLNSQAVTKAFNTQNADTKFLPTLHHFAESSKMPHDMNSKTTSTDAMQTPRLLQDVPLLDLLAHELPNQT